jgi:hypothetical protein
MLEELQAKPVAMAVGGSLHVASFTQRVEQPKRAAFIERNPFRDFAELQLFAVTKNFEHIERLEYRLDYVFVVRFLWQLHRDFNSQNWIPFHEAKEAFCEMKLYLSTSPQAESRGVLSWRDFAE